MRPGVLLVLAKLGLRVSALMALDLPALERPAKATSEPISAGHSPTLLALVENCAERNLMCCVVMEAFIFKLTCILHYFYKNKPC